ncbi:magnesium/cobalt transporter CorA [Emcibacter sp. SYSU 3D8]|uniref:magnesium/cobalt transporter CorA n=1 Tax=Emcibacter sp. SYSU 3D8 TaxID=3133969 RepID=UPI0031FF2450
MAKAQLFDPVTGTRFGGLELIDEWRAAPGSLIWVDLAEPSPEEDAAALRQFGIHSTAIEDALSPRHPPKSEAFDDHTFLLIKGLDAKTRDIAFGTIQIAIFIGERFLVTRHSAFSPSIDKLWNATLEETSMLGKGAAVTALRLVDIVMNRFLGILLAVEERLEWLEKEVTDDPRDALLAELMALKSNLTRMRRIATYHAQMFVELAKDPPPGIPAKLKHELRDMLEKLERLSSLTGLYYDLSSDMVEGYISLASHRLNKIMKVLTIVASIFIPLTFLAGIYGMNFQNIPELQYRYSYYVLLGIMVVVGAGLLVLFKRKGWL